MTAEYIFTSESVTEGHPDKVCDLIADTILDACLAQDKDSHVACEVLCKGANVVLAGEILTAAKIDYEALAREAIEAVGYTDTKEEFNARGVRVTSFITTQSAEINKGVDEKKSLSGEQGAGDQGIMFGYATDETAELMPLPIFLAHRLARGLAEDRKSGAVSWLRPDGKTQVSVQYEDDKPRCVTTVLVSTQHAADIRLDAIRNYVSTSLIPRVLGKWYNPSIKVHVNPTGSFILGGPSADCGVTGRKIIVDTYGGFARHGGGAFSGKDPSKVDRSAAYFCRYVARQVVKMGIAKRAEIQVSYAIGEAQPLSIKVDTFGAGHEKEAMDLVRSFDFRPGAIVRQLELLRPIYTRTTNYGHFGKPELPWEK